MAEFFSEMGGGGLSETEIDRDIGKQMALGPTMEFDAPAWYGEDETYGTQGDWLTGEGLTTRWGQDPHSAYPSYSNPFIEKVATNPAMNMFVNAEGMLRRGGAPSAWDYAALGLSAIPGAAWAVRTARPYVKNATNALRDLRRNPLGSDYSSGQLNRPLTSVLDNTLIGDDLAYSHYSRTMRGRGENPLSRSDWEKLPGHQTRDAMLAKLDEQSILARDVRNMPVDEFLAMDVRMQDRILANANLSRQDIQLVHFVNGERFAGEKLAAELEATGFLPQRKTAAEIRAKIKATDDLIENLSVAEQKRIGIYNQYGSNALKAWRENQAKMALKPAHLNVSDKMWGIVTEGKTLSEVKDMARRLTLRLVDT